MALDHRVHGCSRVLHDERSQRRVSQRRVNCPAIVDAGTLNLVRELPLVQLAITRAATFAVTSKSARDSQEAVEINSRPL